MQQGKITPANRQAGAVLIVGLIMVLLLTIIGMAAIRGSGLQEVMAGNMRDRNLAFQAAEAGLRVAEARIRANTNLIFDGSQSGLYRDLGAAGEALPAGWLIESWASGSVQAVIELQGIASAPRYVIEELTSVTVDPGAAGGCIEVGCGSEMETQIYYRVTALGTGGTNNSQVVLQSTYRQ